jgi:hypothetical protein
MHVFISHIFEEAHEAKALKDGIEAALPDIKVFVSSADLIMGDTWLIEILKHLDTANIMLVLCSPGSVRRPWINFESGIGYAKKARVIPVCYKGLSTNELPDPLAIFQTFELTKTAACRNLVNLLATYLNVPVSENFNPNHMLDTINQAMQIKGPLNTEVIGIVLTHRQDQWEKNRNSVFNLPSSLPPDIRGNWNITKIYDEHTFITKDLFQYAGLILAMPWHAKISQETINAIVEWVYSGGRLLLLGFELGDRHHDSNLAELSHRFGIDPTSGDIVGQRIYPHDSPQGAVIIPKPYGDPVLFRPESSPPHPFNESIVEIVLRNVQTVRVDPGGKEWLHVRENAAYRPIPDGVQYNDGIMATPGINLVEENKYSSWLPVAVEAPKGLCGDGSVQMIGTWDLIGEEKFFSGSNGALLERILNWLAHKIG